jgi:hypothetical protein
MVRIIATGISLVEIHKWNTYGYIRLDSQFGIQENNAYTQQNYTSPIIYESSSKPAPEIRETLCERMHEFDATTDAIILWGNANWITWSNKDTGTQKSDKLRNKTGKSDNRVVESRPRQMEAPHCAQTLHYAQEMQLVWNMKFASERVVLCATQNCSYFQVFYVISVRKCA